MVSLAQDGYDKMTNCDCSNRNLNIFAWEDWSVAMRMLQSGVPANLTGYEASFYVRKFADDPEPILSLSTEEGDIVLGGVLGTIEITMLKEDIQLLLDEQTEFSSYLELTPPSSTPFVLSSFTLQIVFEQ